MFKINLLRTPGLQSVVELPPEPEPEEEHPEDILIDRLASRGGAFVIAHDTGDGAKLPVDMGRRWIPWTAAVVVIVVLAFWTYNGVYPVRKAVDSLLGRRTGITRTAPPRPVPAPRVMQISTAFLEQLPDGTSLTYFEAGAGLVLYHIEGGIDIDQLKSIQSALEGYKLGDVLSITGNRAKKLVGAVTYDDPSPVDIWRPKGGAYDLFFNKLRQSISAGGGEVKRTSVGSQKPGEYVIAGDLALIRAHLQGAAKGPVSANYHRIILLDNPEENGKQYLLRVVFDLVLEELESQPQLSQAGIGD